jgi:hypothetical protein
VPLDTHEPGLSQALQTLGEVGEGLVVGFARRRRAAGRRRVEDVVHALDGEQQQAVGAPAAGPEEEHRVVVAQADEVEARLV